MAGLNERGRISPELWGSPTSKRIIDYKYPGDPLFQVFKKLGRRLDANTDFVPMGEGRISNSGKVLSWEFTTCSGLLLRSTQADQDPTVSLFHFVGNRISPQQEEVLQRLDSVGSMDMLWLRGMWSWQTPTVIDQLSQRYDGNNARRNSYRNKGTGNRFDIMYDIAEGLVYFHSYDDTGFDGVKPPQIEVLEF